MANLKRRFYDTKIKVTGPRLVYALDVCTVDQKVKEIDPTLPTSFLIITDSAGISYNHLGYQE